MHAWEAAIPPFPAHRVSREAAVKCLPWFLRGKCGRPITPEERLTFQMLEEVPRLPEGASLSSTRESSMVELHHGDFDEY
jgi:hypothetical protein